MSLFKFLPFAMGDVVFIAIFVVVFIAFLREFKLTSKQSWVVLVGLTALGGFFIFQTWRRKNFLKQFEAREKALAELEKQYADLKAQAKITEQAYNQAKAELDRAKIEAGLAIMRADQELAQKINAIEREYQSLSVEDSVKKIKEALRSK